jgi:hypothetical protein
MTIAPNDLFGIIPGFFESICSIWIALGARKQFFPKSKSADTLFPTAITLDRQEASSLICELIRLRITYETKRGFVDVSTIRNFIPLLLLLAVDPSTSPALRRTIDDTLAKIWVESAFVYEDIGRRESFITDGSGFIALDILEHTESLPMFVKAQVLVAIGHATFESRSVSRWYAAGLLLPGSLKELNKVSFSVYSQTHKLT